MPSGDRRGAARAAFLADCGLQDAAVIPLAADASFRRYFRVTGGGQSLICMDAPPGQEKPRAFLRLAQRLTAAGFSAPRVFRHDLAQGFLLLEDFGDLTFSSLLAQGASPDKLYALATDCLISLHRQPWRGQIRLAAYSLPVLLREAALLTDWFWPEARGAACPAAVRRDYLRAWRNMLDQPGLPATLVLRDYHVDNLMLLPARDGVRACGLLDFQDALLGSPAYDLASLLEDARRDVPEELAAEMRRRYLNAFPETDPARFTRWMTLLAAQRHAKVLGIFVRLFRRDGKAAYLRHLPRVAGLLERHLHTPVLAPLQRWVAENGLDVTAAAASLAPQACMPADAGAKSGSEGKPA